MSLFLLSTNGSTRLRLPCACVEVTRGWLLLPRWKETDCRSRLRLQLDADLTSPSSQHHRLDSVNIVVILRRVHPWHTECLVIGTFAHLGQQQYNNLPQPPTICVNISPRAKHMFQLSIPRAVIPQVSENSSMILPLLQPWDMLPPFA